MPRPHHYGRLTPWARADPAKETHWTPSEPPLKTGTVPWARALRQSDLERRFVVPPSCCIKASSPRVWRPSGGGSEGGPD
eukprot:8956327-Alexandrium_andersonii.AAC.1